MQVSEEAADNGAVQDGDIRLELGQRRAQGEAGEPDLREPRIRRRRRRRGTQYSYSLMYVSSLRGPYSMR